MTCTLTQRRDNSGILYDQLVIAGAFAPDGKAAGSDLDLEIDSLFNPLSMSTRFFKTTVAARSSRDGQLYSIEEGETAFAATKPTTISAAEVTAVDTLVQTYTQYTLKFQPDVEIEAGAFAMVQFPLNDAGEQFYVLDNNLNSMSTMGSLFGARSDNVAFVVDRGSRKIETKVGTSRYSAGGIATIVLSQIKNPSYVDSFGTFKIRVFDKHRQLIAEVTSGVSYKTTAGTLRDVKVTPSGLFIDEEIRLGVSFVPLHDMPVDAFIRISVTSDVRLRCPVSSEASDFIYNSKNLKSPLNATCEAPPANSSGGYHRVLLASPLREPFVHEDRTAAKAGVYDPGKVLTVQFPKSLNALSAREVRGIRIETLTAAMQPIDTYTDDTTLLYTVVAKPLFLASVQPKTQETYTASLFDFRLVYANKLTFGGYMEVHLPPQVQLVSDEAPKLVPGTNMDPAGSRILRG